MAEMIQAEVLAALEAVAQAKNQTINELLKAWLVQFAAREADPDNPENYRPGSAARLAAAARGMGPLPPLPEGENDISGHADEILQNEFADYLLSRMDRPVDDADTGR